MIKNILEFFRVISELRYIIPLLKYKWPNPDDNASLAHTFQDSVCLLYTSDAADD